MTHFENEGKIDGFLHVQLLSMVNALKTGDPTVDMMLAMFLPYLIGQLSKDLVRWIKNLFEIFQSKPHIEVVHERTITYRSKNTNSGGVLELDKENHNMLLIKAIQLYVDRNCTLNLYEAEIDLTSFEPANKSNASIMQRRKDRTLSDSASAMLRKFDFVERPFPKQFHSLGHFQGHGVSMQVDDTLGETSNSADNEGNGKADTNGVRNIQITLRSASKQSIQHFIKTAYKWYMDQLDSLENNDRIFFDLKGFDASSIPRYWRYELCEEKTFDTLFSQQCHDLKNIVDQFETKTGRYAIKGYPHKLGLLLSGPPGTGKTSLIKALSHYLNRHIVNVPLSRIATNAELMSLLFNKKYAMDDTGMFTEFDFKKVIFVLEDVDAGSPVVKNRELVAAEMKAAMEEAKKNEGGTNRTRRRTARSNGTITDHLSLTGLLNALDGVVETPGRIVIMSTNHPEMLDPALIRPGRIDKQLVLGYMIVDDMVAMLNHFYQTSLTEESRNQLETVYQDGLQITAAQLECLAAESDTVKDLLAVLSKQNSMEKDGKLPSDGSSECPSTIQSGLNADKTCGYVMQAYRHNMPQTYCDMAELDMFDSDGDY